MTVDSCPCRNGVQHSSALGHDRVNQSAIPFADLIKGLPLSDVWIEWREGHRALTPA